MSGTPDGAWAEFLRHEEITSPENLETVMRVLWVMWLVGLVSGYTIGGFIPLSDRLIAPTLVEHADGKTAGEFSRQAPNCRAMQKGRGSLSSARAK